MSDYKDNLNKYYDGLSEFVDLLFKVDINDKLIENIMKETPLNFYKMSKCILNNLANSLDDKQNVAETNLEELKNRYHNLTEEQKFRRRM